MANERAWVTFNLSKGGMKLRRVAQGLAGVAVALLLFVGPLAAATYLEFAQGLVAAMPGGTRVREDLETELVGLANQYRATKGKKALKTDSQFREAARAHAIDMALHDFVGHKASTGQQFDSRMRAFLGNPLVLPKMAENAARDSKPGEVDAAKARRLFQQWVDSPPHRKAMINSGYQFTSVAVIQRGSKIYAVQIFWASPPKSKLFGSGTIVPPPEVTTDGLY